MPFIDSGVAHSGRFTDIRILGRGAHGQVYYAFDTRLNIPVAIKEVLPTDQEFQNTLEKFRREAQIQARLRHTNIISVYDLKEDSQTGEYYLVCEYANAGTLAEYLQQQRPLPEPIAVGIAFDMCAALEKIWSEGIVHCDIKPANILLTADAQGAITAKLGDFGIAKGQLWRETTALPGSPHLGTPLYMAPEQWNVANTLDARADIFALGITLFEIITCQDYKSLLSHEPLPNVCQYNSKVSPAIAQVIQRALQEDRGDRYQTPRDMADDLRARMPGYLSNLDTQRADTALPLVRLSWRPVLSLALVGLVIAGAALVLGMISLAFPTLAMRSNFEPSFASQQPTAAMPAALAPTIRSTFPLTITLHNYFSSERLDNFATASEVGRRQASTSGYQGPGDQGYIFTEQQSGTIPLMLYYNSKQQDYFTTTITDAVALKQPTAGYELLGIEGYIYQIQQRGTIPLELYFNTERQDYFTTATKVGKEKAKSSKYRLVRTLGFILPLKDSAAVSISWDFGGQGRGEEAYYNVCSSPDTNKDASTGLCANINIRNSKVAAVGTKIEVLATDNQYRVCLVANNLPAKSGTWAACQKFVAKNGMTIDFRSSDLHRLPAKR